MYSAQFFSSCTYYWKSTNGAPYMAIKNYTGSAEYNGTGITSWIISAFVYISDNSAVFSLYAGVVFKDEATEMRSQIC